MSPLAVGKGAVTINVPRTTLISVDCQYPQLAARALRVSLDQCNYECAKLLTDDARIRSGLDPRIELVPIPRINSAAEYSRFVVKELLPHVDTDFAQIVQWDGYVTNGAAWQDDFLQYDYIGARWYFIEDDWNVGNGGFSLRSRRLLEALQELDFEVDGPEDHYICRTHRGFLEQAYEIKFAPANVADAYAFEGIQPTLAEFGFHRMFNFPYFHDEATLAELLDAVSDTDFCTAYTVSLVDNLIRLNRKKEALWYAQRMRNNDQLYPKVPPNYRAVLEDLLAGLSAEGFS